MVVMHALTPAERVLLELVDDGTFEQGKGCRHSQDMLAARARERGVRCTREHANRSLKHLEFLGLLRREKHGRAECLTYHAWVFNPSNRGRLALECARLRPGILKLQSERRSRSSSCSEKRFFSEHHTKRTAGLLRDEPQVSSNSLYVVNQRGWSRKNQNLVRTEARNHFERRRNRVPEPARTPLRVVGCPDCEKFRKALDAKQVDIENLETDLKGKRRIISDLRGQVRHLKASREEQAREGANIELIERLWAFHRQHIPGPRNMGFRTVEAVRARLADTVPGTDEPAYSPRYIAEAILGARDDRWAREHGQASLEMVCKSPESLERFHRRYERSRVRIEGRPEESA